MNGGLKNPCYFSTTHGILLKSHNKSRGVTFTGHVVFYKQQQHFYYLQQALIALPENGSRNTWLYSYINAFNRRMAKWYDERLH